MRRFALEKLDGLSGKEAQIITINPPEIKRNYDETQLFVRLESLGGLLHRSVEHPAAVQPDNRFQNQTG